MSVTEHERNHLFAWFQEHMGKERAPTMMNLLPPVGWGDVATRRDLDVLADRLDTTTDAIVGRLDTRIDGLDVKIDLVGARPLLASTRRRQQSGPMSPSFGPTSNGRS